MSGTTAWLVWRLVKLLSVVLLGVGTGAALSGGDRGRRMALVHGLVTPAFLVAWFTGYALMKMSGGTMAPWVLAGALTSLVAFHGSVSHAYSDLPGRLHGALAVGGLLASVAVMVVRPVTWGGAAVPVLAGVVVGGLVSALLPRVAVGPGAGRTEAEAAWRWFVWIARAEGVTLLLLTLVSVPLKYGAGILLDGGTGLLGWTHGMLVFVFLQALWSVGRMLGWSLPTMGMAFVLSMVPFGTFVFEWRQGRTLAPA